MGSAGSVRRGWWPLGRCYKMIGSKVVSVVQIAKKVQPSVAMAVPQSAELFMIFALIIMLNGPIMRAEMTASLHHEAKYSQRPGTRLAALVISTRPAGYCEAGMKRKKKDPAPRCLGCRLDIPISRRRLKSKYCSNKCFGKHRKQEAKKFLFPNLTSGTFGAVGELAISADMMSRGLPVFRSLSPNCLAI